MRNHSAGLWKGGEVLVGGAAILLVFDYYG